MQQIVFCNRCRGMRVGWNRRYIIHCLSCRELLSKPSKLLILTVFASILGWTFSTPTALVFSDQNSDARIQKATFRSATFALADPAIKAIDGFLERYEVDEGQRGRIAKAIVGTGRRYDIDPQLIASI